MHVMYILLLCILIRPMYLYILVVLYHVVHVVVIAYCCFADMHVMYIVLLCILIILFV